MVEKHCPEPGIYENVPFEEYLAWDAISNSRLNIARRSLAHFKAGGSAKSTKSLTLGSLVHCGRLEPLELAKQYAVMPSYENDPENITTSGDRSYSKGTKYVRSKVEAFTAANAGKKIVDAATYEEMMGIVRSLHAHPVASHYLNCGGPVEWSIVWDDAESGLRCKARLDKFAIEHRAVVDLKTYTAQDGGKHPVEKFCRSIVDWGYHRQMAHYVEAAHWARSNYRASAVIVAVETSAPYCVMAAPISDEWLEIGRQERSELMRKVADAYDRDEWPGYESPEAWECPSWAKPAEEPVEVVVGGEKLLV